jgi:tungstate transport system substrate-binding protein
MKRALATALLILAWSGSACTEQSKSRLRLATTTSVQDSGLMPHLMPHFEKQCACKVDVIAVGSGQALKLASNGDVDMVLVHDPAAEKKFVEDGFGVNRKTFMVNDFVILGPASDPARVAGTADAALALSRIYASGTVFISRGDASGTHRKEAALWEKAGIRPEGSRYLQIGQGMGAVLTMADEKKAYTISDRATYLTRSHQLELRILVEGDPDLMNYYSVIEVNPGRFPSVKSALSRKLIEWLCSPEGRSLIDEYEVGGHRLFKAACAAGE